MNSRTLAGVQAQLDATAQAAPTEYTVRVVSRLGDTSYSYAPVLTFDAAMDMIEDELTDPATKYAELHRDVAGRHVVSKYIPSTRK